MCVSNSCQNWQNINATEKIESVIYTAQMTVIPLLSTCLTVSNNAASSFHTVTKQCLN